ncbi:MAG TPA: hypothetical protein VLT33_29220 [Labilithrix sp.]|nr:hypothetical protein [Labilithrix sp.]
MKNQLLFVVLAGVVAACGSTETVVAPPAPAPADTTPVATPDPAPTKPAVDHGAPSTKYPAFAPAMGQLANNGGTVLKNPVIVTVTWAGDDKVDDLESLGDTIGASPYWLATTSEYGAGAAVSGPENHVRLPDAAPASMSDTELSTFVSTNVANGTFPTPTTGDPVYILHLQKATKLLLNGQSACAQGVGGYHDSTKVGIKSVAYAIVPRCGSSFDMVTVSASHELVEAASDPYPRLRPAWSGFGSDDLSWEFFQQFQSENGDACEFYRDSDLRPGTESGLAFTVQRSWSNKSAAAGHDPCVPAFKNTTFFNTTPLDLEDVEVDLSAIGGDLATTKGYKVPVGSTRTIPLGLYSDGPTTAWSIRASAGGIASRQVANVELKLDIESGENGQKAYLTISVNEAGKTGSELISIVSTKGSTSHYMPILIASPPAKN